jgi:hypothetical protein
MYESSSLSPSQTGRRLGLSAARVRQLADAGRLEFVLTPLGRLFDERSVEALRVERETKKEVRDG